MRPRADFCGLPMIRDEGRVVDPPLVFKRVFSKMRADTSRDRIPERGIRNNAVASSPLSHYQQNYCQASSITSLTAPP
ncbi:hypothetical protein TNCV_1087581 [Trichonephila clavipes]|nr:hypothetical protein TNCV_1087581 [Trichonephila clavipes]